MTAKRFALSLIFLLSISTFTVQAQDGKALFKANCASCHALNKNLTGPALEGVESRWPSKSLLKMWIRNWSSAVATGDAYANKIKDWSPVSMNKFDNLQDKEIDAILDYIAKGEPKPAVPKIGRAHV